MKIVTDPEEKLQTYITAVFAPEYFDIQRSILPHSVIITDTNGESVLIFYNAVTGQLNESINGGETTIIYD